MRPINSLALTLLVATSSALAQTASPTLEERMSQADFTAAGLQKLSPEELQALNAWLDAHGSGTVQYRTPSGGTVFYPDESARDNVEDRIVGVFEGWRGKTIFTLENGQKWQQAESGMRDTGKFDNPAVKIKPMLMGSWLMYVEGCGCSLRVKRIE
jgi:hypothetical protein